MATGLALVAAIVLVSSKAASNEIYINQAGDNLELTVVQDGQNNSIGTSLVDACLDGDDTTATLKQWDDNNAMSVCSTGSGNTVKVLQG